MMEYPKIRNNTFLVRRRRRKRLERIKEALFFLPNLFTFCNAFLGFISLIFALKGRLIPAAYLIFWGAFFDAIDGRVARMIGVSSAIGVQLDSLSDMVTFCVAPAFLFYVWQLHQLSWIGMIICAGFALAGLMRLARFNLIHDQQTKFFLGLPTTIAGCFLASCLLAFSQYRNLLTSILFAFLIIALSWLMVSAIPFPAFKQRLKKMSPVLFRIALLFVFFTVIAILRFRVTLCILFIGYFLLAFGRIVAMKKKINIPYL
jgi:CDP-diacylglycerol---serine O-phosphatidyltransferase